MKKTVYLFLAVILVACSGGRQHLLDEIKEKEAIVTKSYNDVLDRSIAESLRQDYLNFAKDYPDDTLAPKFLHKAAELSLAIDMPKEAVSTLDTLIAKYPDYKYLPDAMFFKGFILENHLKDIPSARKAYEDFLKRFPKHELAKQVIATIENLGKSPDEQVKEFMARTDQPDSTASDSAK
jgi:outer membrane protein assembly factor BamD (BamD/ComL family)